MAEWAVICREIREDEKGVSLDFESFEVQPVAGLQLELAEALCPA